MTKQNKEIDYFTIDISQLSLITSGMGYVYFYMPDHPLAVTNGTVPLHRHVMSVHLGRWLDSNEAVTFINGKRDDVRLENLRLLDDKESSWKRLTCATCGKTFLALPSDDNRKYCSPACGHKGARRFEVTPEELENLVWEMPTVKIAEMFGVSDKAIEKRCQKYGIKKPPRGYWAKVEAGKDLKEEHELNPL